MDTKAKPPHLLSRRCSTPRPLPLGDVANRVSNTANAAARGSAGLGAADYTITRTPVTLKSYRRNSNAKTPSFPVAVPFPTVPEEDEISSSSDDDDIDFSHSKFEYVHNPLLESARSREWAEEVSRRQESIRELRDRKIRLEQAQAIASRARKASQKPAYSLLTSGEKKLTTEDLEFISELHASVVWRLWHVDLSPEVFASERLLATRLHLVLMRYGKQNIPVPPIVALSKSHHLMHTFSTRHMMEKDRPGVQSLSQLVAKSLLRQSQSRKRVRTTGVHRDRDVHLGRVSMMEKRKTLVDHRPSPLSGEPITSSSP